jgi:hypothetical protein
LYPSVASSEGIASTSTAHRKAHERVVKTLSRAAGSWRRMRGMPASIRFDIVRTALADIVERLAEMPLTAEVRELRMQAASFSRVIREWDTQPPSEAQREEVTRSVIDLDVKVIALGKSGS